MFTGLFNAFKYGSNYSQQQQNPAMIPYTPKEPDYTPVLIGAGLLLAAILIFKK